ncbi:KH domain-containing protein At4g18375-like isoform X1 [Actinidia eriantha]|uniref:KH domain-containing protein At4g18375-like isoform X1 n=1 Tax=Actinidia eriantha TaxID=165200 RepID=UPI002585EF4A|nr:KH domain-containing protein At4g18375-like isoform X1 [Actinidia eriantha]XP_057481436.1 KH domain-containing protein At4g18375-like isoform X1 [Actinidia eriantha]XP_057481437.1 KH domain-containing protein At4g18375-like isoform X1 [Actinidia eriantha]XP_057481438.1 KH domain-containing protein At4g18375-like isoform X1 [Actinidia eriantha]XP_057481439.1 KH domain-containing protein At4g18375-like isoform X1 [Actinidia eriantha]XP_057481440.1 KH domain-containing protein At4g18375-like i
MAGQRNSYGKRTHSQSDYDDNRGNKRRNHGDDRDHFSIGPEDTVYRYLCPGKKIGSIIGRGGEIVKKLRVDSKSKIRVGETVLGCEERVILIYSSSEETNVFDDSDNRVCPAHDALFRVHDRVVADEGSEETLQVTARLLVPSDQIGCVIGKGGQIVKNIRSETGAQIRIMKDDHLPHCALGSDELVQISGEARVVRKALYQIASRLHGNPSRSQNMLASATPNVYPFGDSIMGPTAGPPIMGLAPLVGPYGGYLDDGGDWSHSYYSSSRDEEFSKDFSLRLLCPTSNIGGVIGKGGTIINQIRQESGAVIKVDSSTSEGDDCIITISSKAFFEDTISPTVEAALRLQPRCSEKVDDDSGLISFTTRLLVPNSQIGCLIGKGGAIITEIRRITKANIRILSKKNLPKVAAEDDEMVQISGDLDIAKDALIQVTSRLRANLFDGEGAISALVPVLPYLPMPTDDRDGLKYDSRDSKRHGRGHCYSGGYGGASDLPAIDSYGNYGGLQSGSSGGGYGGYSGYSSGRTGSAGLFGPISRRKKYGY